MNRGAYIIATTLVMLFFVGMAIFVLRAYDVPMNNLFNSSAAMEQADTVQVFENIKYGSKERNVLDIYLPAGIDKSAEHGVILYLHGGSWTSGDKSSMADDCRQFADNGYVTATMNYSFLNFTGEEKSDFKTMLTEIATALSTIKGYAAAQGVNITKAALSGYSAGAHLAMLYAYSMVENSPLPVLFVQSKAGPADFNTFSLDSPDAKEVMGRMGAEADSQSDAQRAEIMSMMQAVSPVSYIKKGAAPTLLAYGRKDTLVVWQNVVSLMNAFKANDVDYMLVEYPNSDHALNMDADSTKLTVERMVEFAKKYFGY
jgi:acetyl esterase/lipase